MQLNLGTKKNFSEANMRRIISILTGLMSSVSSLEDQCIKEYDENVTYSKGQIVIGSDGYFYEAKTVATGTWDASKWTKIGTDDINEIDLNTVKSWLNLSQEELDNLQKLLKDDQITTTSTFSSSKIYSDLQDAISTVKNYTDTQIGKSKTASYKVVSSEGEMTDKSIIYLLKDASNNNFKMYIVQEDGTPKNIGTTDIDLTQFYDKNYIDNNFYTSADADGKFATITTVDGKVDQTDFDNHTADTVAHMTQDEKDKLVTTDDMSTTIDSTSTDDTVPTNKSVYDNAIANKRLKTYAIAAGADFPDLKTLQDIANNLPSNSIALIDSAYDSTSFFGLPSNKFTIVWMRRYAGRDSIMAYTPTGLSYICTNINKQTWQKVCTTSVDDVPTTRIDLPDISPEFATGYIEFEVYNGVCYMVMFNLAFANTSTGNLLVNIPGIPKRKKNEWHTISNVTSLKPLVVNIGANGGSIEFYTAREVGASYYGTFSYPVAES